MDADALQDLFSEFGPVDVRRMFGGAGLFVGGMMFGLVVDDAIFLKAVGPAAMARFEAEGCAPFGYDTRNGRRVLTSYWRMPDRLYDDMTELAAWARTALDGAHAAAAAKSRLVKPKVKAEKKTEAKAVIKAKTKTKTKTKIKKKKKPIKR